MRTYDLNGKQCQFNKEIKFYDAVEAAGCWLFREPITDLFTFIRICITFYFLVIVICSSMYSSSNHKYNSYWLGIYAEWILYINTFAALLSSYITCIIWYQYKYPQIRSITKHKHGHGNYSIANDSDIELELNEEQQLAINLHSDTDVIEATDRDDNINEEEQQEIERQEYIIKQRNKLNIMTLNNISYGLGSLNGLYKMLLNIGLSAFCMVSISYWLMVNYSLENINDDIDWIVTILNIQYYIFIVALLLFEYFVTFTQLTYFHGALYILAFDGMFSLFIVLFDIIQKEPRITFMGKHTANDKFNLELLALICIFMSGHVGIHLFLTFIKNVFLIQYIKLLKYVEIFDNSSQYKIPSFITIHQIMDPLDFEVIIGEEFVNNIIKEKQAEQYNMDQNASFASEGSDIGYSSHDFNRKDKLNNNINKKKIITNIIKKKLLSMKSKKYGYSTMNMIDSPHLSLGGGTGINYANENAGENNNVIKIVFGSNIHQRYNNMPAVRSLTSYNPNVVMFLGNNIYMDQTPRKFGLMKTSIHDDTTFRYSMNSMFNFWKMEHVKLDPSTEYQRLLKHKDFILCNPDDTLPIVLATWGTHDYGGRNKNSEYENKYHSKSAFLSFLDRIDLKHELTSYIDSMKSSTYRGIYYHYDYHYVFENNNKNNKNISEEDSDNNNSDDNHIFIRFIMLDLKFDRNEQDMFGREQWVWINELLRNTKERKDKPDWHIFAFGNPCFVEKFNLNENMQTQMNNNNNGHEKQFKLPNIISPIPITNDFSEWDILSKRKLLMLINEIGIADRTLFVSGNTNYSQVLKDNETNIFEFISSSFTHTIPSCIPNDYYIKNEYEFSTQQTNVCNVNGYGYLQIHKNGWKFCITDSKGHVYIPLEKTF